MAGRTYQQLHKYKGSMYGSPQYNGIEFDFETPDNVVVASPGGVSTIQHHWTKGMYGTPTSNYDIFAGEGNRYPYGELGNMYSVGQNAATEMQMYPYPPDQMYTGNQSSPHIDNFTKTTPIPGMELIAPPDSTSVQTLADSGDLKSTHKITAPSIWITLLMLVLIYISLDLSVRAGETLMFEKFHGGKSPSWKFLFLYAGIFIALAVLVGLSFKQPFFAIKKIEE